MRYSLTMIAALLFARPLMAHPEHEPVVTAPVAAVDPLVADAAAVRSVLATYKSAIERLDATGTERLFTTDSAIFETGSYANYLAKHLGPELGHFKSFKFSDYKINVRLEGPVALATETYNYRIETAKGEIAQRRGVATSVLKKVGGEWKILSMHNSARTPKGS